MSTTPPGWYPAPDSSGRQQWWDGTQWTNPFAPGQAAAQHPVAPAGVYQQPYQQPPQKSGKGWLWAILGVVAVVVIGGIIGVIALIGVVASSMSSLVDDLDVPATTIETADEYAIEDRPGWDALVARYDETKEKYRTLSDAEIYAIVPATTDGFDYYKDFLYILTDKAGALIFMPGFTSSTDPQELDDTITYWDNELTELERQFLAGEDFGVTIAITQSDGTVYESDGTFPTVDLDAALSFITSYNAQPDASGSYVPAAQTLLDQFGMYVTWADGTNDSSCSSGDSATAALAYYCFLDPSLIFFNSQLIDVNDPDLMNTVRHELSHHAIYLTCGVTSPPVAGALPEGVTSSYAVLFMGADDTLDDGRSADYQMSAATDAAATAIHAGDCG